MMSVPIQIRLEPDILERIDALRCQVLSGVGSIQLSRQGVIKALILSALVEYENRKEK